MSAIMKKTIVLGYLFVLIGVFMCMDALVGPEKPVPILMYHHIILEGETNRDTVTAGKFYQDMLYLKNAGYTPLLPEDLAEVLSGDFVPDKPVMITFDDGYASNYHLAFPTLRETGMKATIALIVSRVDDMTEREEAMRNFLTWDQVREMTDSGLVAFGSHSYNCHNPETKGVPVKERGYGNGICRRAGETRKQYDARAGADLAKSLERIRAETGRPAACFAYPFGMQDRWFDRHLSRNHISVTFLADVRMNADLGRGTRSLPRYAVGMGTDLSELLGEQMENTQWHS